MMLRNESMFRSGTRVKVARAGLRLGVGGLAFLSGATAQTCTTGSQAVAIFGGVAHHSCVLLVSKRPPSGYTRPRLLLQVLVTIIA